MAAPGSDCSDCFAIKSNASYVLLEWFGGPTQEKGDKVQGEFGSYGFKDIFLLPNGARMRV